MFQIKSILGHIISDEAMKAIYVSCMYLFDFDANNYDGSDVFWVRRYNICKCL